MAKKNGAFICQEAREDLRKWLIKYTNCAVQSGIVNGKQEETGWPCGTCTNYFLEEIGLNPQQDEYHEHNETLDRINEVWRAILQIREAPIKR